MTGQAQLRQGIVEIWSFSGLNSRAELILSKHRDAVDGVPSHPFLSSVHSTAGIVPARNGKSRLEAGNTLMMKSSLF